MKARGYFGIGAEGISKPMNFGNLARTAHGFGASFVFTLAPGRRIEQMPADTTNSFDHMPWYTYSGIDTMQLPDDCRLVGVELTDDAIALPSFRHPLRAAYLLGPEHGSLSPEAVEACEFIIKIPTSFCLNVATAGAVIMYDRMQSLGRFAERPVRAGGPMSDHGSPMAAHLPKHVHGQARFEAGRKLPKQKGRTPRGPHPKRYDKARETE
ncbi:MAG: RNA methyltransferase [Pseudomonadota bacterium]